MSRSDTNSVYIVFYDISSNKLRRRVEKKLCDYGVRIQYSVFSVFVSNISYRQLTLELSTILSKNQSLCESTDSLFAIRLNKSEKIDVITGEELPLDSRYLLIG